MPHNKKNTRNKIIARVLNIQVKVKNYALTGVTDTNFLLLRS
jgi:hypothetical protein